jgi:hypothetical protein
MGMSCTIRALTEGQIEAVFANPDRVWDVAYNDEEDWDESDDADDSDNEPIAILLGEPLLEELDLDKSWAILRFLLLKAAGQPLTYDRDDFSSELLHGDGVGDEPADYVGPCLRSVEDTQEFAAFLQPLTVDQLLSHFDWQAMRKADIYLVWDDDADEEEMRGLREYAAQNFVALREYVLKAAASQCGLLLWVN